MSKRSSHGKSWRLRFQAEINMQRPCDGKELSEGTKSRSGMGGGCSGRGGRRGRVKSYKLCRELCNSFLNIIFDYKSMFNSMIYTKITSTNIDFPRHLL